MTNAPSCPICGAASGLVHKLMGQIPPIREFLLNRCPDCQFAFVSDFRTDYEAVYSDEYYQGLGADPLVDYLFELKEFGVTIRRYEWTGLLKIFKHMNQISEDGEAAKLKWLDYGCGLGGLVRFGREKGLDIYGYEPYGLGNSRSLLSAISAAGRGFLRYIIDGRPADGIWDYVTAIEVIEHTHDPLALLADIRQLLKDGGCLFLMTGNAKPHRGKLDNWSYSVCPDIHVSFFEPDTLALALEKSGFKPVFPGYIPGFNEVIAYKVLKNLRIKRHRAIFDLMPWPLLSRAANVLAKVTAMPIGVAC